MSPQQRSLDIALGEVNRCTQWLTDHRTRGERQQADQPFAQVGSPQSEGIKNIQSRLNELGWSPVDQAALGTEPRRDLTPGGIGALVVVAAMLTSCSSGSSPATQATTSVAPASTSGQTSTPTQPCYRRRTHLAGGPDQIYKVIQSFQNSYNTSNWDAYLANMCASMRDKLNDAAIASLNQQRATTGLLKAIVGETTIRGDTAMAYLSQQQEGGTPVQPTYTRLVRQTRRLEDLRILTSAFSDQRPRGSG